MSSGLEEVLAELDAKIRALEALPDTELRDQIFETLALIDAAHRPGVAILAEGLEEAGLMPQAMSDERIRVLFSLYEVTPDDGRDQAELALEAVRPYIQSHGGDVEILRVDDGEVHLRLQGTCTDCPASAATLQHGVRAALADNMPGFRDLVVHPPATEPGEATAAPPDKTANGLVQLRGPIFRDVLAFDDLAERAPTSIAVDEREVLLVRAGDEVYAFDPRCPSCTAPLAEGTVSGWALVCPWTNCAFDLRSGRRIDGDDGGAGAGLGVLPVTVRGGQVSLAGGFAPAPRLTPA